MKPAALLLFFAGASAWGQIPGNSTERELKGSTMLALKGLAVSGSVHTADAAISTTTEAAMAEDARRIFVELRFRLAPYDAASGIDSGRFWKRADAWGLEQQSRDREFITITGARGPTSGLFAAPLFDYDLERLEELTVIDADGREYPAKPVGLSRHGEDVWFDAPGLAALPLPALLPGELKGHARYARLSRDDDGSRVDLNPWFPRTEAPARGVAFRKKSKDASKRELVGREIGLVFDSSGTWRGWLGSGYASKQVLSPAALRQDSIAWADSLRLRRAAEGRIRGILPVLRLHFEARNESALSSWDEAQVPKERVDAGFPLAPKLIFSPRALSPKEVKSLRSVEVLIDGVSRPAKFVGVLTKGVVGYLVAPETPVVAIEPGKLPEDGDLAMAVEPFAVAEALQIWAYLDRLVGTEAGYAGEARRKPLYLRAVGGVIADLDGRPVGLLIEEARHEAAVVKDRWSKPAPLVRLHTFEELSKAFADPEKAVDPRLKPDAAGVRRPWLGAETQDINADLARVLFISEATKGGAVGQYMLGAVPGSPAARVGLKLGDVLLRMQEGGKRQAVPIPAQARRGVDDESHDLNAATRYFRAPRTGLDDALADFGAGTELALTYLRDGKERSVVVTLEDGPLDVESAPKLVDKATGLSVKELTDDVRRLLSLDKSFKGLLIYDVEEASPSKIAGLRPYGILLAVGGKSVSTLKELESLLVSLRAGKTASVSVSSTYMGQPLYSDLRVAP